MPVTAWPSHCSRRRPSAIASALVASRSYCRQGFPPALHQLPADCGCCKKSRRQENIGGLHPGRAARGPHRCTIPATASVSAPVDAVPATRGQAVVFGRRNRAAGALAQLRSTAQQGRAPRPCQPGQWSQASLTAHCIGGPPDGVLKAQADRPPARPRLGSPDAPEAQAGGSGTTHAEGLPASQSTACHFHIGTAISRGPREGEHVEPGRGGFPDHFPRPYRMGLGNTWARTGNSALLWSLCATGRRGPRVWRDVSQNSSGARCKRCAGKAGFQAIGCEVVGIGAGPPEHNSRLRLAHSRTTGSAAPGCRHHGLGGSGGEAWAAHSRGNQGRLPLRIWCEQQLGAMLQEISGSKRALSRHCLILHCWLSGDSAENSWGQPRHHGALERFGNAAPGVSGGSAQAHQHRRGDRSQRSASPQAQQSQGRSHWVKA